MVQSMTGFGSAEKGGFKVEIRSLNHRFMEAFVRMPSGLNSHEMIIRDKLKKSIARGKLDVFVTLEGAGELKLNLDEEAAREVHSALEGLAMSLKVKGDITMDSLLHWKSMFIKEDVSYDSAALQEAFDEALDGLKEMRLKEGVGLRDEVLSIASRIETLNSEVESLCPGVREATKERLRMNIVDLLAEQEVDDRRIVQEAASLADRIDIAEEVARVKSHIGQLREMLDNGGTVGRKLDFLMQEFIREVNTMASKSTDPDIMSRVIEMKSEIERAREQIQNIQ